MRRTGIVLSIFFQTIFKDHLPANKKTYQLCILALFMMSLSCWTTLLNPIHTIKREYIIFKLYKIDSPKLPKLQTDSRRNIMRPAEGGLIFFQSHSWLFDSFTNENACTQSYDLCRWWFYFKRLTEWMSCFTASMSKNLETNAWIPINAGCTSPTLILSSISSRSSALQKVASTNSDSGNSLFLYNFSLVVSMSSSGTSVWLSVAWAYFVLMSTRLCPEHLKPFYKKWNRDCCHVWMFWISTMAELPLWR